MTYYRLLRDNKESGPFSEEEMIAKGFKPYDLIWVEGKSAGWRYPSEIPSFKNFAPAIEEQPYDRFYKKQPPQKLFAEEKNMHPSFSGNTAKTNDNGTSQQPSPASFSPVREHGFQSLPGRHIHVTLPSGNTVNLTTLVSKKENKEIKEPEPFRTPAGTETRQPVYTPVAAPVIIKESVYNDIGSFDKTNYNQPVYPAKKTGLLAVTGLSWGLLAASFIGIATLVGLGIMIGLAMNRDKNEIAFNEAIRHKSKQSAMPATNSASVKPSPGNSQAETPATVTDDAVRPSATANKELVQNAVVKTAVLPENTEAKKLTPDKSIAEKNKESIVPDQPVLHVKPITPPVNLEKNLSLIANDFKTGAFGGISGLKYTLLNSSRYPLESVEVEIDYIQANNKVFKTEKLLFKDISAGAQATIEAPPSNRGVKTAGRIIKINAKEILSNTTAKS